MKLHDVLQIIIAAITIVAMIFKIADIKNEIDKKFQIFVTQYEERKIFVDYLIHGLDEKIQHKFQRLATEINSLEEDLKQDIQQLKEEIKTLKK